ncbi:uncharacterized protein SOCG_03725 [Schizosaccharomyces octosporus yFS286]|uniref:Uncharacterized protein n=1 Tax=Schizosaccharomyces octosporus (strain yFS286) TaxID=483514 RepID=S9PWC9_SCHOY|nr:uncharacterized protein SOCG_03725 [Schizosaccharomyces octosporus yFS286]EPX71788.1 hypothetical protein SOCG_03725 [Schizosaccharomyces octosporus yFS286]
MRTFLTSILLVVLCITFANLHGGVAGGIASAEIVKRDSPTPIVEGDIGGTASGAVFRRKTPKPIHEGDPNAPAWGADN